MGEVAILRSAASSFTALADNYTELDETELLALAALTADLALLLRKVGPGPRAPTS